MAEPNELFEELLRPLRDQAYQVTGGVEPAEEAHHPSVRTFHHAGHDVVIETSYRITIDGVVFPDHLQVGVDGRVHYHGLPQYSSPSAVDLMKVVVEHLSDDEAPPLIGGGAAAPATGGGQHDGHA